MAVRAIDTTRGRDHGPCRRRRGWWWQGSSDDGGAGWGGGWIVGKTGRAGGAVEGGAAGEWMRTLERGFLPERRTAAPWLWYAAMTMFTRS